MEFQISEPFVPKGASPKKQEAKRALKDVKHFLRLNSNNASKCQLPESKMQHQLLNLKTLMTSI